MRDKATSTARSRRTPPDGRPPHERPPDDSPPRGFRPWLLWFGFLGGGGAWFLHHSLGYGLVEINCHSNRLAFEILGLDASLFLGLLLTALAALTALIAAFTAFRSRPQHLLSPQIEEPGEIEWRGRSRFMGFVGSLLSLLFLVAILAGGGAFLFLKPC